MFKKADKKPWTLLYDDFIILKSGFINQINTDIFFMKLQKIENLTVSIQERQLIV